MRHPPASSAGRWRDGTVNEPSAFGAIFCAGSWRTEGDSEPSGGSTVTGVSFATASGLDARAPRELADRYVVAAQRPQALQEELFDDALGVVVFDRADGLPDLLGRHGLALRVARALRFVRFDECSDHFASTYDAAGRLSTVATTVPGVSGSKTISYQYDASGNRTRLTWPDGYYVSYSYDALNRMSQASENGATTLATYTYDPLSRRTGLTYGNATGVTYSYSQSGDLVSLVHDLAGTSNDATTTLTYNLAHQLASETFSNTAWRPSAPANATTAYTVNGLNQYPSVASTSYQWDAQGNLTADGVWTYGFDGENRLLTASKTGVAAVYTYDPRGRRTMKSGTGVTTTLFLDSGDDEIAEYDASNTLTRRFVPGPEIDQPIAMVTAAGARTYFHVNHQGSVVAMSDASGNLAEGPYTYDAYGNVSSSAGEPYKFTGRRLDNETGLYYYRARYYSAALGRFLQTDPVGYKDDYDLYTYVWNEPTDKTDPSGQTTAGALAGAAIGGDVGEGLGALAGLACGPGAPACEVGTVSAGATAGALAGALIGDRVTGPNISPNKNADQDRVKAQKERRRERRENQSRKGTSQKQGNGQNKRGETRPTNKGPSGERPSGPDRSNNRERNQGVDEEHSMKPKGGLAPQKPQTSS